MNFERETRLSYTDKAKKILAQMSIEEKIYLMSANYNMFVYFKKTRYNETPYVAGGNERLGVPPIRFCDGPRGVVSGRSTCFPVAMARGATFDRDLQRRVGEAIGDEVKANDGNFFAGICVNIPYNPGDGRSQESYGEDSYHIAQMASETMRGVQSRGVVACVKHFAFNSMENARFKVNVVADKRTEREVYLRHFKKVLDNGCAALMSSYNKYKRQYCGHNTYLLREVAKGEWNFDSFVMSDFILGVRSARGGISGGCDVEMRFTMRYTQKAVKRALKKGQISEAMIDDAALRIIRTMVAFEEEYKSVPVDKSVIASAAHIALAKETADKSITLLKNDGSLPLRGKKKIAVVGDLAAEKNIGDYGSSSVMPPYVVSVKEAFEDIEGVQTLYVSTDDVLARAEEIKSCDAAIAVCGNKHDDEGEYIWGLFRKSIGGDRKNLGLKNKEIAVIKQLCNLTKTAVVLMGGNAITMEGWADLPNAVLFAYYPGMEGGTSVRDVLLGKVNPSGKLPFVIAKKDADYPQVNWNAKGQHYDYYHGYRKLDKENVLPQYPYGFGLSYTRFVLSNLRVDAKEDKVTVCGKIKNVGNEYGGEVVQVYVGCKGSKYDRPVRTLCGFDKLYLSPDEEKAFAIDIDMTQTDIFDENSNSFIHEACQYFAYVGTDEVSAGNNVLEVIMK